MPPTRYRAPLVPAPAPPPGKRRHVGWVWEIDESPRETAESKLQEAQELAIREAMSSRTRTQGGSEIAMGGAGSSTGGIGRRSERTQMKLLMSVKYRADGDVDDGSQSMTRRREIAIQQAVSLSNGRSSGAAVDGRKRKRGGETEASMSGSDSETGTDTEMEARAADTKASSPEPSFSTHNSPTREPNPSQVPPDQSNQPPAPTRPPPGPSTADLNQETKKGPPEMGSGTGEPEANFFDGEEAFEATNKPSDEDDEAVMMQTEVRTTSPPPNNSKRAILQEAKAKKGMTKKAKAVSPPSIGAAGETASPGPSSEGPLTAAPTAEEADKKSWKTATANSTAAKVQWDKIRKATPALRSKPARAFGAGKPEKRAKATEVAIPPSQTATRGKVGVTTTQPGSAINVTTRSTAPPMGTFYDAMPSVVINGSNRPIGQASSAAAARLNSQAYAHVPLGGSGGKFSLASLSGDSSGRDGRPSGLDRAVEDPLQSPAMSEGGSFKINLSRLLKEAKDRSGCVSGTGAGEFGNQGGNTVSGGPPMDRSRSSTAALPLTAYSQTSAMPSGRTPAAAFLHSAGLRSAQSTSGSSPGPNDLAKVARRYFQSVEEYQMGLAVRNAAPVGKNGLRVLPRVKPNPQTEATLKLSVVPHLDEAPVGDSANPHPSGASDEDPSRPKGYFFCPKEGCTKLYLQRAGLKYHLAKGQCQYKVRENFTHRCNQPGCNKTYNTRDGLKSHLDKDNCRHAPSARRSATPPPHPVSAQSTAEVIVPREQSIPLLSSVPLHISPKHSPLHVSPKPSPLHVPPTPSSSHVAPKPSPSHAAAAPSLQISLPLPPLRPNTDAVLSMATRRSSQGSASVQPVHRLPPRMTPRLSRSRSPTFAASRRTSAMQARHSAVPASWNHKPDRYGADAHSQYLPHRAYHLPHDPYRHPYPPVQQPEREEGSYLLSRFLDPPLGPEPWPWYPNYQYPGYPPTYPPSYHPQPAWGW